MASSAVRQGGQPAVIRDGAFRVGAEGISWGKPNQARGGRDYASAAGDNESQARAKATA